MTTTAAVTRPTLTPVNKQIQTDRLILTFAFICTHPFHWNQATWRCDTGMCFAGHAAITIAGLQPVLDLKHKDEREYAAENDFEWLLYAPRGWQDAVPLSEYIESYAQVDDPAPDAIKPKMKRNVVNIQDYATTWLGLGQYERDELFSGNNDVTHIVRKISDIIGIEEDEVIKRTKQVAREQGWRWPRKQLTERFGVNW